MNTHIISHDIRLRIFFRLVNFLRMDVSLWSLGE